MSLCGSGLGGKAHLTPMSLAISCSPNLGRENPSKEKKSKRKALIPLPPTGFVSLSCAKSEVVQAKLKPPPAGGVVGKLAFSLIAKVFSQMQKLRIVSLEAFKTA